MKTSTPRVAYPGPLAKRSARAGTLFSPNNTQDAGIMFIFWGHEPHDWERFRWQPEQIPTCGSLVFIFYHVVLSLNVQIKDFLYSHKRFRKAPPSALALIIGRQIVLHLEKTLKQSPQSQKTAVFGAPISPAIPLLLCRLSPAHMHARSHFMS